MSGSAGYTFPNVGDTGWGDTLNGQLNRLAQEKADSASPTFTGSVTFSNDVTISGNLLVSGSTTTINSTVVTFDDPTLILNDVTSPTDANAASGGFLLKATTDKSFVWINSSSAWTSSEHLNLLTGKSYYINGVSVLSSNTLGSGITNSSLTSFGASPSFTGTVNLGSSVATGSVASALNSASLGGVAAASYAQLASANFTAASVGSNRITTTADNLSAFANTTSAQLASKITDETGTGSLVFNTAPTFSGTVNLGSSVATGSVQYLGSTANVLGGVAGGIVYQTAANTTAVTGSGAQGAYLYMGAGNVPTWAPTTAIVFYGPSASVASNQYTVNNTGSGTLTGTDFFKFNYVANSASNYYWCWRLYHGLGRIPLSYTLTNASGSPIPLGAAQIITGPTMYQIANSASGFNGGINNLTASTTMGWLSPSATISATNQLNYIEVRIPLGTVAASGHTASAAASAYRLVMW